MTTYTGWIAGLAAISVTGVAKNFGKAVPQTLLPPQLPAMWVRYPRGDQMPIVAEGGGRFGKTLRAEIVIVVSPCRDGFHADIVDSVLTMMDNLSSALADNEPALSKNNWSIRPGVLRRTGATESETIDYDAVFADVSATG